MNPKSGSLFHFKEKREYLLDVLQFGFWPRYCVEDIQWLDYSFTGRAFPMVCFCEIPFNRMSTHLKNYGRYGIGVKRSWAESNSINPVQYVVPNSSVADIMKELKSNGSFAQLQQLAAYCKPVRGKMPRFKKEVDFYQESEWRYVASSPFAESSLGEDQYNDISKLEKHNQKSKRVNSLEITPEDIEFILVAEDADIPFFFDELQKQYSSITNFPVLASKITTVKRLMENV